MSDKLLSYLDAFPLITNVWVNPKLEYISGPAEGFVKMTRDEALEAIMSGYTPDTDVVPVDLTPDEDKKEGDPNKAPIPDVPAPKIQISKPPIK